MDAVINRAKPLMAAASIGHDKTISEGRVSKNAWLEDGYPDIDPISKKINDITGLATAEKFDDFQEGKREEYEMLQVFIFIYLHYIYNLPNYLFFFFKYLNKRILSPGLFKV